MVSGIVLVAKVVLAGFLLFNASNHFMKLGHLAQYAGFKGVAQPKIAVFGTGVFLAVMGISVILNLSTIGAVSAALFFIPVSFKMHDFWNMDGEAKAGELVNFTKNIALLAALLVIFLS